LYFWNNAKVMLAVFVYVYVRAFAFAQKAGWAVIAWRSASGAFREWTHGAHLHFAENAIYISLRLLWQAVLPRVCVF
jgi:hypothetical protein